MAYAFDKIGTMLGQNQDDQNPKTDIFNPTGQTGAQGSGSAGPNPGQSSAGDLTSGSSSGGESRVGGQPRSSDVSQSAAYQANLGKQNSPADFSGIQKETQTKSDALQNEADSYVAHNTGTSQLSDTDKADLRQAVDKNAPNGPVSGDESGFAASGPARNTLDYWAGVMHASPTTIDPFKSTTDTTDPNVEMLGTNAGVQQLLRRQGGPEYGAGDAAFDQALLARDTGFQQQRQGALKDYADLQTRKGTIGDFTTNRARTSAGMAHSAYLADLQNQLKGLQGTYTGNAQAQEKGAEDMASGYAQRLMGDAKNVFGKELSSFKNDPANAGLKDYATDPNFDLYYKQFAKNNWDPSAHGWQDYLNQDQADTFNNIGSLLGEGGGYKAGAFAGGPKASDLVSYDTAGMDKAIRDQATGGKAKADADAEAARQAAAKQAEAQRQAEAAAAASAAAAPHNTPPADAGTLPGAVSAAVQGVQDNEGQLQRQDNSPLPPALQPVSVPIIQPVDNEPGPVTGILNHVNPQIPGVFPQIQKLLGRRFG